MENFQRLSRFLVLPVFAAFGFAACSIDEGEGGSSGGAGGAAPSGAGSPAAGTSSTGGMILPSGGTSGGGQPSTSGNGSGGAGASTGGQPTGGSAGAAGSGGAGGAAGSAGSGGGAAMGCTGFTGKFCDDFEGQTVGTAPVGDFKVEGDVKVDTSKAYSGTKSLKITKPSPSGQLQFSKQFPYNDLHGRAMFYVTGTPAGQSGPHWDLVVAVSDGGINWEIGGMYGKFLLIIDPPDTGVGSSVFPTGKWFCLQWEYKFAGAGQDHTFVAKMDGVALPNGEFTGKDSEGHTWAAGPWKNLAVGFTYYGNSALDVEMWVDDIAFGEAPIACPAAK